MNYAEFRQCVQPYPVITGQVLTLLGLDAWPTRMNLQRWQTKGKVIRLRRDVYVLNPEDARLAPSRMVMAGEMYPPSYLSLEYALGLYGMIPERVTDMTSITAKKPMIFANAYGTFRYQHIKPEAFSGFRMEQDEKGLPYFLATPEKALLDFVYLKSRVEKSSLGKDWRESYRLDNLRMLNQKKIKYYLGLFASRRLASIVEELMGE